MIDPLWITVDQFLTKLNILFLCNSIITLLGIFPKNCKHGHMKTCSMMFIAALFIIAKTWKQPTCPAVGE
jgi:hypothetical protein